ncbi:MAG: hypothetical protein GY870_11080 [archaeon]|nr:hypothetical protein [archaeon]
MNLEKKHIRIYKIIFCVLTWIDMGLLFAGLFFRGSDIISYTFQSNLLVFLWITIDVIYELLGKEKPKILGSPTHGAVTVYITVTFVIFALIFQSIIALGYGIAYIFDIVNLMCHYIVPVLMIIEWGLTHEDDEYEKKWALYWLIYPFIYLACSMILELITGSYYYFFTSIGLLGALVIVPVALLTLFFYGISRLLFYVHERK